MNSFLAGLSIGIGTAFLFAPSSGRQTRRQISRRAGNALGSLKQQASRMAPDELSEQVSRVGERVSELAGRLQSQVAGAPARAVHDRDIAGLLNNCSKDELVAVKGIGPVLADRIIRNRPYNSDREVLEREILGEPAFQALKEEFLRKPA